MLKTKQIINIHQLVVKPFRISQMEKLIKEICKSKMHV